MYSEWEKALNELLDTPEKTEGVRTYLNIATQKSPAEAIEWLEQSGLEGKIILQAAFIRYADRFARDNKIEVDNPTTAMSLLALATFQIGDVR